MSRIGKEMHQALNEVVIEALFSRKIYTVLDFIKADSQSLSKRTRLTFKDILDIKKTLANKFSPRPISGFDDYKIISKNATIIFTGLKSVDSILKGGLFTGNIYEICGCRSAGKSQFAFTVLKSALLQKVNVFLLDGKSDFVMKGFKQLLSKYDPKTQEDCLKRLFIKQLFTKFDLFNSLYEIKGDLNRSENARNLRLVIIDSLPAFFPLINSQTERTSYLNQFANILRFIAVEYHVAFLVINLITKWKDNFDDTVSENITGGKYWANVPNVRLNIEKFELDKYKIRLMQPNQQNCDAIIRITDSELVD